MSFAELKRNRKEMFNQINDKIKKINSPGETSVGEDDRFWKASMDKVGNGYAVIRFLPPPEGESVPWARVFSHGFQGPTGKWYIENSLTTLNQKDPVTEYNNKLWASGSDKDKEVARKQKRKLNYYSNIYVIEDPANPENEGKVFLFRYGKKIFDKINSLMNPEFQDEEQINPFDLWEGANFKLRIRKVDGYANYDKCEFMTQSELFEDDSEMERVYKSEHSLEEFLSADKFKSYEVLEKRLNSVLELESSQNTYTRREEPKMEIERREEVRQQKPVVTAESVSDDDDDDSLSYFAQLADE